jgi:hypothetical protein
MPTSAQLIDAQYEFESPRGLLEYNKGARGVSRMLFEVDEAIDELEAGRLPEMMTEIVDMVIFAHSILGWLARETGTRYEDIDRLIEQKMETNLIKYDLRFFDGKTPDEALREVKEAWKQKS